MFQYVEQDPCGLIHLMKQVNTIQQQWVRVMCNYTKLKELDQRDIEDFEITNDLFLIHQCQLIGRMPPIPVIFFANDIVVGEKNWNHEYMSNLFVQRKIEENRKKLRINELIFDSGFSI